MPATSSALPPPDPLSSDVLIVDDEPMIGSVLMRTLRRLGASTYCVGSSLHAIRALEAKTFRVVVTDQHMPGPDGADLLATIEQRWPRVRRLLMSAWLDADLLSSCPSAHRVIDKSYPLARIVEVIMEEVARAKRP